MSLLPNDTVTQLISIQQLHSAANRKQPAILVLFLPMARKLISSLKHCRFFFLPLIRYNNKRWRKKDERESGPLKLPISFLQIISSKMLKAKTLSQFSKVFFFFNLSPFKKNECGFSFNQNLNKGVEEKGNKHFVPFDISEMNHWMATVTREINHSLSYYHLKKKPKQLLWLKYSQKNHLSIQL